MVLTVYTDENMACLSDNHFNFKGVNIMAVPDDRFEHSQWNSIKTFEILFVAVPIHLTEGLLSTSEQTQHFPRYMIIN
jgi:prephenate dehydrogenase